MESLNGKKKIENGKFGIRKRNKKDHYREQEVLLRTSY